VLKTRTFKNFESEKFCNDLRNADWSNVIGSKMTNKITDMNAPLVSRRISSKTGWVRSLKNLEEKLKNEISKKESCTNNM